MAKGNWKPDVIQPRPRCRLCTRVIRKSDEFVRLDGVIPSHKSCADEKGRKYTAGKEIKGADK